jgi:hypothetical protein
VVSVAEAPEVLLQRAARLSSVTAHPGWEEHVAEAKREIARIEKRMLFEAKRPEGADQRMLDYARGYIDALKFTYKMPVAAGRKHERWLEELEEE